MAAKVRPANSAQRRELAAKARKRQEERRIENMRGIRNIEFSLSAEIRPKGQGSRWVKFGGTVDPWEGETPEEAKDRLVSFVAGALMEQVDILLDGGDD